MGKGNIRYLLRPMEVKEMVGEIYLELKHNPKFPTAEVPRHRFEKPLIEAPWSNAIEATIDLDDPAWELLGFPQRLRVTIAPVL